jgi:death-on-curing protein
VSEPVFLTVAQVERLHQKSISRFGGASGVRDRGLFEGAIIQPRHTYYYANGDLFDVASAYAYHIAQAQTDFDSMPLYKAMIAIAEKRMDKAQLAQLLRELCSSG